MNNDRRKRIGELSQELEILQDKLDDLKNEECDAYDNMPEELQQSERGQDSENAANELESAYASIDNALDSLRGLEG
jgi:hypothetical protein